MPDKKMEEGDVRAWLHAVASGRFPMLTEEEQERVVMLAIISRQVGDNDPSPMPGKDLEAILAWAHMTRMRNALLDNMLAGKAWVRMRPGDDEPAFNLTPAGEREARRIGRAAGLPVTDDDDEEAVG